MSRADDSRRLGAVLAVSFGLTVTSFLGARAVSEHQSHGIREAAETIGLHALPANDLLADLRSELRRTESLIGNVEQNVVARGAPPPAELERVRQALEESRKSIDEPWTEYRALPAFSTERSASDELDSNMRQVDAAFRQVASSKNDPAATLEALQSMRVPLQRADDAATTMSGVNRRTAVEAAERVTRYRQSSRGWGLALDAASVVLALATLYVVSRVNRRFWNLVQDRVEGLEYFAGRVAHDVRSPLASVSLAIDLAMKRAELDGRSRAHLDRALRTLQRVGQLVDGLLAFALAGRPPSDEIRSSVREVLDGIVEDARPYADENGISLEYEAPSASLRAACAPGVLASMTSNMVTNALKYIGDGAVKRVGIRARATASSVRVEVRDTGPGLPLSLRARAFEPYVRGADSNIPGFGLGLATVRRLAEAHGGTVGALPNADIGMLFWFELPRARGDETAPVADHHAVEAGASTEASASTHA